MNEQETLLKIVKTWNINPKPEYRGFRCADCQRYLHKAFHHHLKYDGFDTSVHFCRRCQGKSGIDKGIHKSFTCDKCGRNFYKAFHIWTKQSKKLVEDHYCKSCWENLLR